MRPRSIVVATLSLCLCLSGILPGTARGQQQAQPANMFQNPSFEDGREPYGMSNEADTKTSFEIDTTRAIAGQSSALVTLEASTGYGTQFGQRLAPGQVGKTYTFAVLGRSVGGPVTARLEIERAGSPWDRAAVSGFSVLTEDEWTELHTTFTVATDFAPGWFAYVSCTQSGARFNVDMFRLCEGDYVPYATGAGAPKSAGPANILANPSFELGTAAWNLGAAPGTDFTLEVTKDAAIEGASSALITVHAVAEWGVQFGQRVAGGPVGKTYTFAAFARSVKGPVRVRLEIERPANPWDRAGSSDEVVLGDDKWTELHTTFTVKTPFPEGWTAYVSCAQPECQFRVDMLRLYEGDYVPFGEAGEQVAEAAGPAGQPPAPQPRPGAPEVRLFDTGVALPWALAPEAFSRMDGWVEVGEADAAHQFAGDVVALNNKLALVLRAAGPGVEVYSMSAAGPRIRAVLAPDAPTPLAGLSAVKVTTVSPESVALEASYHCVGGGDVALSLELRMGEADVKTKPCGDLKALLVRAPCRFAVLPDFFADDIVIDAAQLSVAQAELPAENMLLHMMPGRDAIVMAVWNTSSRDIQMDLSGQGEHRMLTSTRIYYGEDPGIWVAVLDAPDVWHVRDVAGVDAGRTIRLDWRAPWPAHWRVDWTRDDNLVDSWEMLAQNPDGSYQKPNWYGARETVPANRQRWTTVLGNFLYPCWADRDGQGYLEPLGQVVQFRGPALIYPMNRLQDTPLGALAVLDVVRNTLGVGPCEYILDLEDQGSVNKGMATCGVKDLLDPIYAAGQQKERRAQVEKALDDVLTFIRFIRSRIDTYVEFGHGVLDYVAEQKVVHPELAGPLSELEKLAKTIDACVAARRQMIKTPEYAAQLVEEFRQTVLDKDDPDALARCQKITAAWVEIGGNQDHLAGECRWAVKFLRQRAGLLMAQDPRMTEVAREIRSRAQTAMQHPAGHEAIHH